MATVEVRVRHHWTHLSASGAVNGPVLWVVECKDCSFEKRTPLKDHAEEDALMHELAAEMIHAPMLQGPAEATALFRLSQALLSQIVRERP